MLDYTPVHIAYPRNIKITPIEEKNIDVRADVKEEPMELNLRLDLSHLMMINLVLNFVIIITMLLLVRKY